MQINKKIEFGEHYSYSVISIRTKSLLLKGYNPTVNDR